VEVRSCSRIREERPSNSMAQTGGEYVEYEGIGAGRAERSRKVPGSSQFKSQGTAKRKRRSEVQKEKEDAHKKIAAKAFDGSTRTPKHLQTGANGRAGGIVEDACVLVLRPKAFAAIFLCASSFSFCTSDRALSFCCPLRFELA